MANDYGLSAQGFKRKRLPDVIDSLSTRISDKLGIEIQKGSNSIFGQLIGVFSYEVASLWEQAENVYNAMYPNTAQGTSLSNAAALAGISLIEAERTTLVATCYGTEGTVIPFNAQISSQNDTERVYTCTDVNKTISASRANYIELTIPAVTVGTEYSIDIDGTEKSYTAVADDTATAVFIAIASQFSDASKTFSVENDVLTITANEADKESVITVDNINIRLIGSPFNFACSQFGSINPAVNSLTNIVNAIAGWDSVNNTQPATVGRDNETDISLRQRWSSSVYTTATAMVEAIKAAIFSNVDGAKAVIVYENTSDTTDADGRPPHSVEVIADGGDNYDIASELWRRKPAGIDTFGSVSVDVTDSQGVTHTMNFNRPTPVKVWLKAEIQENPEEEFPVGGLVDIANALLAKGNTQEIGEDVILQRYFATIFNSTKGIGYISLTATTGDTEGVYSADNIEISAREVATFDISRIEVTIA